MLKLRLALPLFEGDATSTWLGSEKVVVRTSSFRGGGSIAGDFREFLFSDKQTQTSSGFLYRTVDASIGRLLNSIVAARLL